MTATAYYALLCLAIGVLGRNRRGGIIAFTVIAIFLHPLLALVLLFVSGPKKISEVGTRKIKKRRALYPGEKRPLWPQAPSPEDSQGTDDSERPRRRWFSGWRRAA